MSTHPMTADGRVDMDPHFAMIRHCTWAGCPGIDMLVPIIEREHGYSHDICNTADQAPFVHADADRIVAHVEDVLRRNLTGGMGYPNNEFQRGVVAGSLDALVRLGYDDEALERGEFVRA